MCRAGEGLLKQRGCEGGQTLLCHALHTHGLHREWCPLELCSAVALLSDRARRAGRVQGHRSKSAEQAWGVGQKPVPSGVPSRGRKERRLCRCGPFRLDYTVNWEQINSSLPPQSRHLEIDSQVWKNRFSVVAHSLFV